MVLTEACVVLSCTKNGQLVQDNHQELMQSLSITGFPTFRFYLEGAQVDETRGPNINEIAQKVRKRKTFVG